MATHESRTIVAAVASLFLASIFAPGAAAWEVDAIATVTRVIDGDTFDSTPIGRVRLADIDAPERGEPGFEQATDLLVSLVLDQDVFLDIDDVYGTDFYGRFVCVVFIRHNATHLMNVNQRLLEAGVVVVSDYDNEFDPRTWTLYVPSGVPPPEPEPLSVDFSVNVTSGTAPLAVSFAAIVAGGRPAYLYSWDFGDGFVSDAPNPSHTYTFPGIYQVALTVTDADGHIGTAATQITSTEPPRLVEMGGIPPWAYGLVSAAIVTVLASLVAWRRSRLRESPPRPP